MLIFHHCFSEESFMELYPKILNDHTSSPFPHRQTIINHPLPGICSRASPHNLPALEFISVSRGDGGGEAVIFFGEHR